MKPQIVLGVDPGSQITGFGVISRVGDNYKILEAGAIVVDPRKTFAERLLVIGTQIKTVIQAHRPHAISMEKVFFAKNADSALKLGQARGVILYEAALAHMAIYEYSPTEVKQGVVGNGRASKEQVQTLVKAILAADEKWARFDVSDALALAIHHLRVDETATKLWQQELTL